MKEYYLDMHSITCNNNSGVEVLDKWCENHPESFLFFLGNQFWLLHYNACLNCGDRYSFRKEIVQSAIKNNKVFELYEVRKSVDVEKELKEFRLRNRPMRKYVQQVNYIYYSNNTKAYAITTKTKFKEWMLNGDEISESYNNAKIFLKNSGREDLIKELENLYLNNPVPFYGWDNEISKSIEHLVKTINKEVNIKTQNANATH